LFSPNVFGEESCPLVQVPQADVVTVICLGKEIDAEFGFFFSSFFRVNFKGVFF